MAVQTASGEPSGVQMLAYLARRLGRAHAQDDAVQDQPPEQPRDLDHARVAQELGQVAAQRRRRRRVGRAEVDQQHGRARGAAVLVRRFGAEAHGRRRDAAPLSRARSRAASRAGCGVDRLGPAAGEAGLGRALAHRRRHRRRCTGRPARRQAGLAGAAWQQRRAVGVGQVQVDHQHLGAALARQLQRLGAAARRCDTLRRRQRRRRHLSNSIRLMRSSST